MAFRYNEFWGVHGQIEAVCGEEKLEGGYGDRDQADDYRGTVSYFKTIQRQLAATIEN